MLTNSNILYVYCEIMEQLEPKRVLDIGMFYKAAGCVSRRILNKEAPGSCYIKGVCTDSIKNLGVYKTVYDEIVDINAFFDGDKESFDLSVILSDAVCLRDREGLVKAAAKISTYMLAYEDDVRYLEKFCDIKALDVGSDRCVLVKF